MTLQFFRAIWTSDASRQFLLRLTTETLRHGDKKKETRTLFQICVICAICGFFTSSDPEEKTEPRLLSAKRSDGRSNGSAAASSRLSLDSLRVRSPEFGGGGYIQTTICSPWRRSFSGHTLYR